MKFDLKPISPTSVRAALDKATRYRLLNEPWESESICLDVLAVEPDNQEALVTLILSCTDQLPQGDAEDRAWRRIEQLGTEYQKLYYSGILLERKGKAQIEMHLPGGVAYGSLRRAMDFYEKAIAVRPPDNEDALLRWNTCARMIMRHRLEPERDGFRPYGD